MDEKIILKLNNIALELTNDSYKESFSSVDNVNTSEAGTTLRDVTRTGIPSLSVAYKCDGMEKAKLDAFNKASSLTATRYDETEQDDIEWECFMSGYSADLIIETSNTRMYAVSFKLEDLETGE